LSGSAERRPLKILHIDPERNWGGGEAQVIGLLTYLAAKGHRNRLLADPGGSLFARSQGLDIERVPFVLRNDFDLRRVPELRRQIAREKYHVVHFHTKRAHALSLWLPRGQGCPKYVVTRRMDYPEKSNWYTRRLYNRRVDGVVAISQAILDILIGAGVDRQKIRLIHSGIDPVSLCALPARPVSRDSAYVLGCLGGLDPRKGQSELLSALAILKARKLKFACVIGGSGPLRADLEKQAADQGLRDSVEFLGFVADVPGFFAAIDIFVMPSRFEGLGVAVLEAMAAGKAVVASRVGGLTESVVDGETGLLVPKGDVTALAEAIAALLQEPARANEMGRQGRARVLEYFTLEQMAQKNEAFYYQMLGADEPRHSCG
jgi:glycosyltransferase involved in cell wall biosynthesis